MLTQCLKLERAMKKAKGQSDEADDFVAGETEIETYPTEAWTRENIVNLRHARSGDREAQHTLADRLEGCTRKRPCNSAACPRCVTAEQERAIDELSKFWPDGTPLVMKTIIIPKLHRPVGELHTIQMPSIKRHFRRKIKTSCLEHIPIWGCIDLSLNIHSDDAYETYWCPHLTFMTLEKHKVDLAKFDDVLRYDASTKRPSRTDTVRDWKKQVSYVSKTRPVRRIDFNKTSSKARPTKRWLKPSQNVEYLLWLGDCKPAERMFLLNIGRNGEGLYLRSEMILSKARLMKVTN